jgi:antitoxin VapB
MALSLKNPEADRLARELARRQGKPITTVVVHALRAELEKENQKARSSGIAKRLMEIGERFSKLPVMDSRTEEEILGWDENGLPT